MVIGIFGPIGSGKSAVAKIIKDSYGYFIIDGDQIGHSVTELPSVRQEIIQNFGQEILSINGKISRKKLSDIVFTIKNKKSKLESILWPKMTDKISNLILANNNVVLDAAVLFLAHWNLFCDKTIYIGASIAKIEDYVKKRILSSEKLNKIYKSQESIIQGKEFADYCIENEGSYSDLIKKVRTIMDSIDKTRSINK